MGVHQTLCRVCHNACPILVDVRDGRAVSVTGDPNGPVHHGYSCVKGRALPAIENSPTRLLQSMKRTSDAGFSPIGSSAALDEIAERLQAIIAEHGPRSVANYGGTKMMSSAPAANVMDALFDAIGSRMRFTSNTIDQPGKAIAKGMHGYWMAPAQTFDRPGCVMFLGTNGLVSYGGGPTGDPGRYLKDLAAAGARTIVVDPRRTPLAARATLHLQPRPGHDVAILACFIRTVIDEGLHDSQFVADEVDGFEALRSAVDPFTPHTVAERADVPADDLVTAARLFATAGRGYAVAGTGPNFGGANGTLTEYLVLALDTICGHHLRAGESVRNPGTLIPVVSAVAQAAPPIPAYGFGEQMRFRGLTETLAGPPTATLPEEILTPGPGQVRALFVLGGNPAAAWPDQVATVEALRDLDLLVTIDPEMSLTAQLAHYVLAPTTTLEMPGFTLLSDLLLFYGNGVAGFADAAAQYTPAVTERPAGSDLLEDWEVFYGLAQRMGLELSMRAGASFVPGSPPAVALDMARPPTTDQLIDMLAGGSRVPIDEIRSRPGQHLYPSTIVVAPKEPGWTHRLDVGNDEMMRELAGNAETRPVPDGGRPLRLISRRVQHMLNSSYNIDATNRGRSHNVAYLNPADLLRLGLEADQLADISSDQATVRVVVGSDTTLRPGTVSMTHCYGSMPGTHEDPRVVGASANRLLSNTAAFDPISGQPLMSNIPVSVSRADDAAVAH